MTNKIQKIINVNDKYICSYCKYDEQLSFAFTHFYCAMCNSVYEFMSEDSTDPNNQNAIITNIHYSYIKNLDPFERVTLQTHMSPNNSYRNAIPTNNSTWRLYHKTEKMGSGDTGIIRSFNEWKKLFDFSLPFPISKDELCEFMEKYKALI